MVRCEPRFNDTFWIRGFSVKGEATLSGKYTARRVLNEAKLNKRARTHSRRGTQANRRKGKKRGTEENRSREKIEKRLQRDEAAGFIACREKGWLKSLGEKISFRCSRSFCGR